MLQRRLPPASSWNGIEATPNLDVKKLSVSAKGVETLLTQ